MVEEKKEPKPSSPSDVAKKLQTNITNIGTIPKGPYKVTEKIEWSPSPKELEGHPGTHKGKK